MSINHSISKFILFILIGFLSFSYASGQVTTATLTGVIYSPKGEPLERASVSVEFPDAGIKEMRFTQKDGRFTITNLRVGGPYRISASHVSFQASGYDSLFLELGQNNAPDISLFENKATLTEVVISSQGGGTQMKKTGASDVISSRQLKIMPTISRSADDFLRLSPSASNNFNGMSFIGRNAQYNNFSLDGAIFNNSFGLDAPSPGGQTNAQPISLDAIDQIQVALAPFDVTQAGFTGAGVNTVTKSGKNKTAGTIYGFYRNQAMTGKKVDGVKFTVPDLDHFQGGASLGGALIKNKLFYFVNFETEQRTDEATAYRAQNAENANLPNTSRVLEQDLINISNILRSRYGYETGAYQGFSFEQVNYKWLAKLDWNINKVHKLAFTYNGLQASKGKPAHPSALGRRGPDYTTLQFKNSGYNMINRINSVSAELKSNWEGNYSNKMRVVYSAFDDKREPFSTAFPVLNISKYGINYIIAGHEPFSINNHINQYAFQATNNFTITKLQHNITAGISYESFKFKNFFNLTGYGTSLFQTVDIQTFLDSVPAGGNIFGSSSLDDEVAYANNRKMADRWNQYQLAAAQLSAYIQDEWQINKKLKVTYGLRLDNAWYFNTSFKSPVMNPDGTYSGNDISASPTLANNDPLTLFDESGNPVQNGVGKELDNTRLPKSTLLSPRLGFSWDVKGNKSAVIRGGSGLFTGRFPFVWVGNQIGNPFSYYYNVTNRNFRWPQVWRSNLGADLKIKSSTLLTLDLLYTKDIHAVVVRNYKLGTPTGVLNSGTGDNRLIYQNSDQGAANAYVVGSGNQGHQFNFSMQAQRTFRNGFFAMMGYNYMMAKDVYSVSAEISSDAFDRSPIINNANNPGLSPSLYGNKHRIISMLSKKITYGRDSRLGTTITLFASWASGNRYAYVYSGDINNDGSSFNDLMYVPTDAEIDQMNFSTLIDANGITRDANAQRAALKSFISQDAYLDGLRGSYTEKYGAETPWFSQADLRIMHDWKLKNSDNTIQFTLDIINLGNLLNSSWGVRKYATTSGYYQPLSVKLDNNAPVYQFDTNLKNTFERSPDLQSRWQMQFGVRYIF